MASTVSMTAAVHVMLCTAVTEQQVNAWKAVSPDGKDFSVNKVMFIFTA